MRGALSDRRVLLVLAVFYTAFIFYSPQTAPQRKAESLIGVPTRFYGDGFRYYQLTKAIAEEGRLHVYENLSEILDPTSLSLGVGGRVYTTHAPALSFLAAPFFIILGAPGLYLLNALLGLATCHFIYRICGLYVGVRSAAHTTLFFGLGTMIFTYSQVFYSDILAAALASASFYFLMKHLKLGGLGYALTAGLLAGIMPLAKPTLALIAILFLGYTLVRGGCKPALYFVAGLLITGWMYPAYNTVCFGSPLKTGYNTYLYPVDGEIQAVNLNTRGFWSNNPLKTVPVLTLITLLTQPILFTSAAGALIDRRSEVKLVTASYLVLALAHGVRFDSIGGWCWSWRMILSVIPLSALPAALALEHKLVSEAIIRRLFIVSAYITFLSHAPITWHFLASLPLVKLVQYNPPLI